MIRKLSIYYIIFIIAFTWGILVGYKKVFPYKYVSIIFKEFVAFYKGGKDIKDISVVEKIKNDVGLFPSRHIAEYNGKQENSLELKINEFDPRRVLKPTIINQFNNQEKTFFEKGYLLIQGFFDFNESLHGALLIDVNGNIINTWKYKDFEFSDKEFSLKKNLDTHPIVILEDGSIVYTIHNTGFGTRIIKTSYCNDILWSNEASYHHSLALDSNQNIWTINAEESFVLINKNNGNIIKEIFLKDIVKKNRNLGLFNFHINLPSNSIMNKDPFHINDVEPLNFSFGKFQKDDLLLSFRNSNLVFIVDDQNNIKWWKVGSTIRQHDPDWHNGYITVFDNSMRNNSVISENDFMSRIVKINLKNSEMEEIFNGRKNNAYTVIKGNHQILENEYILLTLSMQGRIIIVDKNSDIKFEFLNKYKNSFNGILGEAIWLDEDYFDFDLKNEKCN